MGLKTIIHLLTEIRTPRVSIMKPNFKVNQTPKSKTFSNKPKL